MSKLFLNFVRCYAFPFFFNARRFRRNTHQSLISRIVRTQEFCILLQNNSFIKLWNIYLMSIYLLRYLSITIVSGRNFRKFYLFSDHLSNFYLHFQIMETKLNSVQMTISVHSIFQIKVKFHCHQMKTCLVWTNQVSVLWWRYQ